MDNRERYEKELEDIEKEMVLLQKKKKAILDEEKKKKESKKTERYKEVQNAYNNFVKLLEAYEKDFNEGYCVSITGEFH